MGELVALGVSAEVVTIVEHENACARRRGTAIIPRCRQPADAAADHDQIVTLVGRCLVGAEIHATARERMRDLERTIMLAAEPDEGRRIARWCCRQLLSWRQAGRSRQGHAVEKVATGNAVH